MNFKYIITLIILIVISVIIILYLYWNNNYIKENLIGVWAADDYFNKEAEIDGLILTIDKNDKGYILMYSGDTILLNQKITIKFSGPAYSWCKWNGKVTIEDLEDDDIIPNDLDVEFDVNIGKLIFHKDETEYMRLYKDASSTELVKNVNKESNVLEL